MRIGEAKINDWFYERSLKSTGELGESVSINCGDRFEILEDFDVKDTDSRFYTVRSLKKDKITIYRKSNTILIDKNEELEIKLW